MKTLQLAAYNKQLETALLKTYPDHPLQPIFGAGCLSNPIVLVFMNPTYRNIAAQPNYKGMRAPWIGINYAWKLFSKLKIISTPVETIPHPYAWTDSLAKDLYQQVAQSGFYITNYSKLTQSHSDAPTDGSYEFSAHWLQKELKLLQPKAVIALGTEIYKRITGGSIKLSEAITLLPQFFKQTSPVIPCYYPLGRGQRHLPQFFKVFNKIRTHYRV